MSAWLEGGRPAILAALATACDKIDKQARAGMQSFPTNDRMFAGMLTIRKELQARDCKHTELLDEIQALKSRAAEAGRLKQENESLKAEIHRLRDGREEDRLSSPKKRTILGELSPNKSASGQHASSCKIQSSDEASDAATKYTKLFTEAKMLKAKHEGTLEKLRDCRAALRKRNDALKEWAKFADGQQQTIQKLRARLKSLSIPTDGVSMEQTRRPGDTAPAGEETLASITPQKPNPLSSCEDERPISPTLFAKPYRITTPTSPKRVLSEPPPRIKADGIFGDLPDDVTFEGGAAPADDVALPPHLDHSAQRSLVTFKAEQSSDAPVFLSTRPVRKRKHEEGPEGGRLRSIKSEHSSSSSPEITAELDHFSPAKSIDFEEEVHVPTPRKRRALRRGVPGSLDADSDASPQRRTVGIPRPEAHRLLSGPDKSHACSHGDIGLKPPSHWSSTFSKSTLSHISRSVVKNNKLGSTTPYISPLTLGVMDLADDGEASSTSIQRPVAKGRLDALLNNSPSANIISRINRDISRRLEATRPVSCQNDDDAARLPPPRLWVPANNTKLRDSATTAMIGHRSGISPSSMPTVVRDRGPKRPSILRDDMPRGRSATREEVPLRDRPIERLRPEDFRPNPKYNDGLTYVYDEVVRGKEARAALSGCTDLKCCGKTFRRFAEAEKEAVGSSVTTRAEDVSLMERYLGDQAWELGAMAREEKDETWLLAKTWELANKFGKHRQRYSRMPTPPGFWNVDFPSTQERAEERRQAEEIRTALVHERYREAMRRSGSWLFRDEEPR